LSNRKIVSFAQRNVLASRVVNAIGRARARDVLARLRPWLPESGRILDIGTGTAHVGEAVRAGGHDLLACDITDLRFVSEPLVLADGASLPFMDASFAAALLSTVLHHAPADSHAAMLSEGTRVLRPGGRLLVLEDIYRNGFERATTRFVDAITNAQLFGEPHSNRSLEDWIELVNQLSLRLVHTSESFVWFGFVRLRQALLVIERA
jgi:SAM-dependent methyltransferase